MVLCVLLLSPVTWGWGRTRSFASGVSVLPVVPDPAGLIAWGWQWQALRPGVRVPAQGTSEVSAVCLGCLLCDCLHVSLLASVSGFALCRCARSLVMVARLRAVIALSFLCLSPCRMQNPRLHRQQQVASQLELEACVLAALPVPLQVCSGLGVMWGAPPAASVVPMAAASAVPVCRLRQNRTCTRWG